MSCELRPEVNRLIDGEERGRPEVETTSSSAALMMVKFVFKECAFSSFFMIICTKKGAAKLLCLGIKIIFPGAGLTGALPLSASACVSERIPQFGVIKKLMMFRLNSLIQLWRKIRYQLSGKFSDYG